MVSGPLVHHPYTAAAAAAFGGGGDGGDDTGEGKAAGNSDDADGASDDAGGATYGAAGAAGAGDGRADPGADGGAGAVARRWSGLIRVWPGPTDSESRMPDGTAALCAEQ